MENLKKDEVGVDISKSCLRHGAGNVNHGGWFAVDDFSVT